MADRDNKTDWSAAFTELQRAALRFAIALLREGHGKPPNELWPRITFEDAIAALDRWATDEEPQAGRRAEEVKQLKPGERVMCPICGEEVSVRGDRRRPAIAGLAANLRATPARSAASQDRLTDLNRAVSASPICM